MKYCFCKRIHFSQNSLPFVVQRFELLVEVRVHLIPPSLRLVQVHGGADEFPVHVQVVLFALELGEDGEELWRVPHPPQHPRDGEHPLTPLVQHDEVLRTEGRWHRGGGWCEVDGVKWMKRNGWCEMD